MDNYIKRILKNLSSQRRGLAEELRGVRDEDECFGCYKYDDLRVKGEETGIQDYRNKAVIELKCPRCEKTWQMIILKTPGWKKKYSRYAKNFRKLKKEKDKFLQKL